MKLIYIDLFCGAGGTSTGVESARINGKQCAKVIACINHDANAIASHAANHPEALHCTEDIRTLDLTQLVKHVNLMRKKFVNAFVVIWASLECTNHSKAKGGVSRDADSRTLAGHLIRYIKAIDPDYLQIENVEEFMDWGPLIVKIKRDTETGYEYCPLTIKKEGKGRKAIVRYLPTMVPDPQRKGEYYNRWVSDVKGCGYAFDYRTLNAADYGAYTSRKRFFGIFAKHGLPIVWPKPTHAKEAENNLFGSRKKWKPVKEVLDFSNEGRSIFTRPKPLSENTLKRISDGVIKFGAGGKEAFISAYYGNGSNVHSVNRPAPTVTTKDRFYLVSPFFMNHYSGVGQLSGIDQPSPTVTTVPKQRLIFIDQQFGQSRPADIDQPLGALTTNPKYALVECHPWIMNTNFNNVGSSIEEPSQVITANRKWHYLLTPKCYPDPVKIFESDSPMTKKLKEIMILYRIVDIKMRPLKIPELKRIMGFPEDYVLIGTQTDQKKFIGNAVEVNMARVLCEAIAYKFITNRVVAELNL